MPRKLSILLLVTVGTQITRALASRTGTPHGIVFSTCAPQAAATTRIELAETPCPVNL